jgi:ribonuclease J
MSSNERLIYLPLGGAGEIGMNTYVYGYGPKDKERLIVVDLGITFPDMDTTPGVDVIMANIDWLVARKDRIEGIFITHAHEDHIGALGHLWRSLRAPIHCRKFTAHHAARKLGEHGGDENAITIADPWPAQITAGPFTVGFLPVSHSIPESSALVIDSPAGRVVHTGDFKLDETPLVGEAWDPKLWGEVAGKGIHALVCDSTNVFSPKPGRSEASLVEPLTEMISNAGGMVVATTFASNVARVRTLAVAGVAAGRSVCLLGRSMERMVEASRATDVLPDFPATIDVEEALDIPRGDLMLLVTGSQGERRAASAQLARGKYRGLTVADGDTFLFSSKIIPGNERGVISIINAYSEMGVSVVDGEDGHYHVSGHANRPDLLAVHDLMKPKMVIPMHGEHRHLREHAMLAAEKGRASIIATNGTMLDLTGKTPKVAEHVETSRTYRDGDVYIGELDGVIRDRIRMALNGHVMVSLILENNQMVGDAWCEIMGLPETGSSNAPLVDVLEEDINQLIGRSSRKVLGDDDKLDEAVRKAVRRSARDEIGKKPEVTVVVSRLG